MPNFRHILNVRTRAIPPEYKSQWYDRVFSYAVAPPGQDFIEAGYPYSTGDKQIIDSPYTLDGEINEGTMLTIAGAPMYLISGAQMRRISG